MKFTSPHRYGFNGKEKDDEVKGAGNSQDYGMRIYDPRLGKFLSVDPITKQYPELTPYQFASNTPIQAIDLDGLEAVKVDFGTRGTFLFVSVAASVSVVAAPDGVAFFITPEAGLGTGISASAGVSLSFYPNVKEASQLGGWGVNAGLSVMGNGGDLSASIQQDANGKPNDLKLGAVGAIPKTGPGVGAEAHLTAGYSFQIGETISWKAIYENISAMAEDLGLNENDLAAVVEKLKNAQIQLTQQQQKPVIPPPIIQKSKTEEIAVKPKDSKASKAQNNDKNAPSPVKETKSKKSK